MLKTEPSLKQREHQLSYLQDIQNRNWPPLSALRLQIDANGGITRTLTIHPRLAAPIPINGPGISQQNTGMYKVDADGRWNWWGIDATNPPPANNSTVASDTSSEQSNSTVYEPLKSIARWMHSGTP